IDGNLNMMMAPPGTNTDGNITGATGVTATAYTNSFGTGGSPATPAGTTTQFTLDAASNTLFFQNPPNSGAQVGALPITLNGAPLDFTEISGFDIVSNVRVAMSNTAVSAAAGGGSGFAVLTVGGVAGLYRINLATGAATALGSVGMGSTTLSGLALANVPTGTLSFAVPNVTVNEAEGTLTVMVTRTGGSLGAASVDVSVAMGGTATAGTDFTFTSPTTVLFADGQTTAMLTIPLTADGMMEMPETFTLMLSNATNGAVLGTSTLVVTLNDASIAAVAPTLTTPAATGTEDTPIPLSITATSNAAAGLETISVRVSGIPAGATLSAGTVQADGSVVLTAAQLTGLTINPPANFSGSFSLTVVATATRAGGGTASTTNTLAVNVTAVNDAPRSNVSSLTRVVTGRIATVTTAQLRSQFQFTDFDQRTSPRIGIAISRAVGPGVWQYRNPGSTRFITLPQVSRTRVFLLAFGGRLRFVPNDPSAANPYRNASVSFRAWDQTTGTAGRSFTLPTSQIGRAGAFSTRTSTLRLTGDAPSMNSAAVDAFFRDQESRD
ncbi:MAG: DUF4394 domain-containing protein, partial [Planctomycetia bacterium]